MGFEITTKHSWEAYCERELHILTPILLRLGYTLEAHQPHLEGERYLMQAVTTTSGRKLILLGAREDGTRVVIKATRDTYGKKELAHERGCQSLLKHIDFAAHTFHTPHVLYDGSEGGFSIVITEFIPQEKSFLERDSREQFQYALRAFKGQEGAHATTSKHLARISKNFEIRDSTTYLEHFRSFQENIVKKYPDPKKLMSRILYGEQLLTSHKKIIEQYTGFLTHTDFVPHNFRIADDTIFLLDHSSLTFGNKYEGWARFINFMTLYNPLLEKLLVQYVHDNRTPEESISLRMMRIYRLGEIIWYYTKTLEASEGNLFMLNHARIVFWSDVLLAICENRPVPIETIETYKKMRDELRSSEEKDRQQNLH